jgi:hypothetical protein
MDLPRSELVTRLGDSPEDQKSWELRPTEADMILLIPETNSPCLVDWRFVTITGNAMPPRDPNDEDDDEEEEDEEDEDREPPVVREPDPDE